MQVSLGNGRKIQIRCHPDISEALRNGQRQILKKIEAMTGKAIAIKIDPSMHIEQFDLVET